MHSQNHCANASRSRERGLVCALAFLLCWVADAGATVAQYVDPSGFEKYALISDTRNNGKLNFNSTVINGNTGILGNSLDGLNHDKINGNLGYSSSSFELEDGLKVSGVVSRDLTLANTFQKAADFSKTIAGFTPTLTIGSDINNGTRITGNGGINVIAMNGVNANGVITLDGSANDIFYINVKSNLNISGVVLSHGVAANHVFWNIINGQSNNLTGTLNGTFLAFNASGNATQINLSQATLNGDLFAGSLNMNNVNINGLPSTSDLVGMAMVPEASTKMAMGLFAGLIFGAPLLRRFRNRSRSDDGLVLQSAEAL